MAARRRFVDSHVHLWDVHLHPWYKSFPKAGDHVLGYTFEAPWIEHFLWEEYRAAVASVDLVKWVHVSAVNSPDNVDEEIAWITGIADAADAPPYAIVGTIDYRQPAAALEAGLERQMAHPGFRGVRLLGAVDYESPGVDWLFRTLASHGHLFDVSSSQQTMGVAIEVLARHPELTAVLEHVGLPLGIDRTALEEWRTRIRPYSERPNTYLKLYGLGTAVHGTDHDLFRMFFDAAIELFGVERCMFGTGFPPDLTYGTGAELFAAFEAVAGRYSSDEADRLYAGTAEQVYRI